MYSQILHVNIVIKQLLFTWILRRVIVSLYIIYVQSTATIAQQVTENIFCMLRLHRKTMNRKIGTLDKSIYTQMNHQKCLIFYTE